MAPTTIELLITELAEMLYPIESAASSQVQAKALINILGWDLPPGVNDIGLTGLNVKPLIEKLLAVINSTPQEQEDTILMASRYLELLTAVANLIKAIDSMVNKISTIAGISGSYLSKTKINQNLLKRLLDFLIIKYTEKNHLSFFASLKLMGLFEIKQYKENSNIYQRAHHRYTINWDRIGDFFSDTGTLMQKVYGWGTAKLDTTDLLVNIAHLLQSFGAEAGVYNLRQKAEEQLVAKPVPEAKTKPMPEIYLSLLKGFGLDNLDIGLAAFGLRPTNTGGKDGGIGIRPFATGATKLKFPLFSGVTLEIDSSLDIKGGVVLLLRPDKTIEVKSGLEGKGTGTNVGSGRILMKLVHSPENSKPFEILSIPGGSSLTAKKAFIGGGAGLVSSNSFDILIEGGIEGAEFVFDPSKGDSFINKILPSKGFKSTFDLIFGWSRIGGLYFRGSASLEIKLPVHLSLGPIDIKGIYIRISLSKDGKIPIELSTSIAAKLGPLTVVVDRIGAKAEFDFPGKGGNLGPVNLDLGFKPPKGIGLSIDGGGFKGGGFLSFDTDNHRYTGVLELEFQKTISIKAIGLLTTKLPGGKDGFSLLIIISAEFTPVQLGYGFTLNGVGGLLGLNRTMKIEPLRTGLKANTLKSILFPQDVVKNCNQIISDLRQIFPPQDKRFVFGPMAKIGWGTPTLVHIDLGLMIEVPSPVRIALLGVVKAQIPDEKLKLICLQVNFLGVIDFSKKQISFDASLYESKIGQWSLTGDMALRLCWGDNPNFLLTVGGFHPTFNPPAMSLKKVERLTVYLLGGKNPRITLESYFAVTSNTVQFGAKLELYAAAWKFNVYGFMAFDVLFQFSPFHFIASISAMLAVRFGSSSLFSISLAFSLSGPTPWNARGTASFTILFFITVKVRFNKTFGKKVHKTLPDIAVLPKLEKSIKDKSSWLAQIPAANNLQVSIRKIKDVKDAPVVHPFGVLTVSQKVVPLDLKIDKFGNQKPKKCNKFSLNKITSNKKTLGITNVKEFFAPAQFIEMKDAAKLSRKSFEKYNSGVKISSSEDINFSDYTTKEVQYELKYLEPKKYLFIKAANLFSFPQLDYNCLLAGNAISKCQLSHAQTAKSPAAPGEVSLNQEEYAVVNADDLTLYDKDSLVNSEAEAYDRMSELIEEDSGLSRKIQVIPKFEVNT